MNKIQAIAAGAAFAVAFFAGDARAYTVINNQVDQSGNCLVVTTFNGQKWSLPTSQNPLNPIPNVSHIEAAGYLGSAVISYKQSSNSGATTYVKLYWDIGPADPNCYYYPQILNLRFAQ